MRARIVITCSLGLLLFFCETFHSGGATASGNSCDRACLNGVVDQYLAAMVAHDSSHLPLAKTVKFTEDGVPLDLGDGLWATASGLSNYKVYFDEPAAGVELSERDEVLALLRKLTGQGLAVLASTSEAEQLAGAEVALTLRDGQLHGPRRDQGATVLALRRRG